MISNERLKRLRVARCELKSKIQDTRYKMWVASVRIRWFLVEENQFTVYGFQFIEKRKGGSDKSDPYIRDYTILQNKKKG